MRTDFRFNAGVRVSVIIPAFNEEKLVAETLAGIHESSSALAEMGWSVEIIVCDNNSTDRTADIARAAGAKVVFEPVNQIGRARNTGAAAAVGDWLVFVDADSQPSSALFHEMADAIESGRVLAGGSVIRMEGGPWTAVCITGIWNLLSRGMKLMAGSFIFVEADAFHAIGGFDLKWYAGEELDLSRRLKQHGRLSQRGLRILHRHPLLTSARKMHLYQPREHLKIILRLLISRGASLRSKEDAFLWYDGRR